MGGTRAATHLLGGSFRLYLAPFPKTKTPSRTELRPRRRQNFLIHQRLCQRWPRNYAYPGSMLLLPTEG